MFYVDLFQKKDPWYLLGNGIQGRFDICIILSSDRFRSEENNENYSAIISLYSYQY